MHSLRVDRINRLLEQRVTGSPDLAEIAESGAAARAAVKALGAGPGGHRALYDCSDMGPVGDDVIAGAFAQWADPRFTCVRARKVALVLPSALLRLKIAEASKARANMAVFGERAEAMRWLFA